MLHHRHRILVFLIAMVMGVAMVMARGDGSAGPVAASPSGGCVVLPHMEGPILPGRSYVYCPSFQMAWDVFRKDILLGNPVRFVDQAPKLADVLNAGSYPATTIPAGDCLVMCGRRGQGILEKIRTAFTERFGNDEEVLADLNALPPPQSPDDAVAFAYLQASLGFAEPFSVFRRPTRFQSASGMRLVEGFGIQGVAAGEEQNWEARHRQMQQVRVRHYRHEREFIVSLFAHRRGEAQAAVPPAECDEYPEDPNAGAEEIVIARIPPGPTLRATWEDVLRRMDEPSIAFLEEAQLRPKEVLRIPKLSLHERKRYEELIGQRIRAPSLQDPSVPVDLRIVEALQAIRFRLDERGVEMKSHSLLSGVGGVPQYTPPPRRFVVDGPFLLALRRTESERDPYLVLWVANADWCAAAQEPPGGSPYEKGLQQAEAALGQGGRVWMDPPGRGGCEELRGRVRKEFFRTRTENANGFTGEDLDEYIAGCNDRTLVALRQEYGEDVLEQIEARTRECCGPPMRLGLRWLKERQNADGSWGEREEARPVLTALAVLANLGYGQTPREKEFGDSVTRGLRYLTGNACDRILPDVAGLPADTLVSIAVLEAYSVTKDAGLVPVVRERIRRLLDTPAAAAGPWHAMALRSALETGEHAEEIRQKMARLAKGAQEALAGCRASGDEQGFWYWALVSLYRSEPGSSEVSAAVAARLRGGFDWNTPPGETPLQTWHAQTVAALLVGGDVWKAWQPAMLQSLTDARSLRGYYDYPPKGKPIDTVALPGDDARIFTTAMSNLMLSVYYRYVSFCRLPTDLLKNGAEESKNEVNIEIL